MIGFSIPLQRPEDPDARAEMEGHALQMAAMLAKMPAALDGQLRAGFRDGRARLARELGRYWPAGPGRPPEVARLVERYGEDDAGGGESAPLPSNDALQPTGAPRSMRL